jgi:hypothetical protein
MIFLTFYIAQSNLQYNWYNPRRNDPNAPKLNKAWAYYEHITLPRHFVGELAADTVMRRAEPGEHEEDTQLYNALKLPVTTLIEWGTGIDLYFISLRFFAVLMLFAGLTNIYTIWYFAGEEYNGDKPSELSLPMQGSAVCTNADWVVCTDCSADEWSRDLGRYAEADDDTVLVRRNFCDLSSFQVGIANFVTLLVVLIGVGIFSYYLRLREIRFDEDKVTTTDYSIVVNNPPPDAVDPDQWRDFFNQFATDGDQVTVVTVALNNEKLVQKLVIRRIFLNQLRVKLPPKTNLDNEDEVHVAVARFNKEKEEQEIGCIGKIIEGIVFPILNIFSMMLPPDALVEKISKLTQEIMELQEKNYAATNVFVTFETEEGQRTSLDALNVGYFSSSVAPECLFDGKVLRVTQPTEPNAGKFFNWDDIN